MSAAENKEIVRRYFEEIWNQGKVERTGDYHTTDFVLNDPSTPTPRRGLEAATQYRQMWQTTSPDLRFSVEEQVAEGDMVCTWLTSTGTQEGELLGLPPTHKRVTSTVVTFHRLRSGKICEARVFWDALAFLRESGMLAKLAPPIAAVQP